MHKANDGRPPKNTVLIAEQNLLTRFHPISHKLHSFFLSSIKLKSLT